MNASRKLAVASEIGRRQFVNLLGDAVAWPVIAVQAQQGGRVQHPLALDRRDETGHPNRRPTEEIPPQSNLISERLLRNPQAASNPQNFQTYKAVDDPVSATAV
jgi:hypothetical protein